MIRIFNHYVHRASLRSMFFDLTLALLVAIGAIAFQVGGIDHAMPMAGTHVVSFAAGLFVINSASGLYEVAPLGSFSRACAKALLVLLVALPLAYAIFGLLPAEMVSRGAIQFTVMAGVSALVMRRVYVSHWGTARAARTRILIFGAGAAAVVVGKTLKASDPNAHIVGYVAGPNELEPAVPADELLSLTGSLTETVERLNVDEIVVALTERRAGSMPLRQLLDCKLSGIKVYDLNTHFEKTLGQIRIDFLSASWLIFGDGFNQGAWRTAVKRVFDIVCASVLIVLSAPHHGDHGDPDQAREPRPRALPAGARRPATARPSTSPSSAACAPTPRKTASRAGPRANDDRVTRVGNVIRRLRIDELPQLFNVLKGEMSLVGPRPERPFFVEQLTQEIPFYAVRHSVKPGVTGWAQVRYHYGSTVEDSQEKLQYDLYYVKNHTLFLDLVVLLETVGVVLTGKGAR